MGKVNNLCICSVYFFFEVYRKILNGRWEIYNIVLLILFCLKYDCMLRSVCYEKLSKRRWFEINDENNVCLVNQFLLGVIDSENLIYVDYFYVDFFKVEYDYLYCLLLENDLILK